MAEGVVKQLRIRTAGQIYVWGVSGYVYWSGGGGDRR